MKVLYFANLKESLGISEEKLNNQFETVDDLIGYLSTRGEQWKSMLENNSRLQIAVNQQLARRNTAINANDEVAFFPPVTGG